MTIHYEVMKRSSVDPMRQAISNYFHTIGKYRGQHFMDMKHIIAVELYNNGLTRAKVGEILSIDHTTVTHLYNNRKGSSRYDDVKMYYKQWIYRGVYPVSDKDAIRRNAEFIEDGFNLKKI